jgi:hypothetical protein
VKRLPRALDLLAQTAGPLADLTINLKENLTSKFKSNFKGLL